MNEAHADTFPDTERDRVPHEEKRAEVEEAFEPESLNEFLEAEYQAERQEALEQGWYDQAD